MQPAFAAANYHDSYFGLGPSGRWRFVSTVTVAGQLFADAHRVRRELKMHRDRILVRFRVSAGADFEVVFAAYRNHFGGFIYDGSVAGKLPDCDRGCRGKPLF